MATLGITRDAGDLFMQTDGLPTFLPFVTSLLNGKETASVWFARQSPNSLIPAFRQDRDFLFLDEGEAKVMFNIALGIVEHHSTPVDLMQPNFFHSRHRALLADTYKDAFKDPLRKTDIYGHLALSDVFIASNVPENNSFRIVVGGKKLHTKTREETKVVLDLTPDCIQQILDSFLAIGGTLIVNKAARCQVASAIVVRPYIASVDL